MEIILPSGVPECDAIYLYVRLTMYLSFSLGRLGGKGTYY
uniref:Uncharacterized protein n=1 Tax=Anguilla anguilla TaxID=7936 RepID=A0A0E9V6V8_ANGAN